MTKKFIFFYFGDDEIQENPFQIIGFYLNYLYVSLDFNRKRRQIQVTLVVRKLTFMSILRKLTYPVTSCAHENNIDNNNNNR